MSTVKLLAFGAIAAAALIVVGKVAKSLPSLATVGNSLNPASDQNLAYKGVSVVVQALPGSSKDETLGTWWHKTFSGDDAKVAAMLNAPTAPVRTSDADANFWTSWNNPAGDYTP